MRVVFRNFTGGEVTPTLCARYDLNKFGSFLQCCQNFIPNLHGDIERRPGTKFLCGLGKETVLLPFAFNTEPENNYILAFSNGALNIYSRDGELLYTLISDYKLEDVYSLSYAQSADIVYFAHKDYPLKKLVRSGTAPDYIWSFGDVSLNSSLEAPETTSAVWHRGPKSSSNDDLYKQNETSILRYVVSAVDENGIESTAGPVAEVTARYPTDWVNGDYVTISWPPVIGAEEYNIYRESGGYYGFIGVVQAVDTNMEATTSVLTSITLNDNIFMLQSKKVGVYIVSATEEQSDHIRVTTAGNKYNCFYNAKKKQLIAKSRYSSGVWYLISNVSESLIGNYSKYVKITADSSNTKYPGSTVTGYTVEPVYKETYGFVFKDQNFEPDTATTPKKDWFPFKDENNPCTVTFHQQRLVLGGTKNNPANFYMSRTGDFENFRKSSPSQDDDPVEYMLASGSVDDIHWMCSFGDLLIGTAGAEYKAGSSGVITPSSISISVQSYWGSASISPLIIGQSILHAQRSGSHVRDLYYSWESEGYAGNDLSLLAPQLAEAGDLKQWAFQQTPGSRVYIVRSDGVLLCLTYMKEQNIFGWSRHITDGKVKSVISLNGCDEDEIYMVVQRTVNGADKYFLEKLMPVFKQEQALEDAWYADCAKLTEFEEPSDTVTGLEYLEGKTITVLADGATMPDREVKDGKITLDFPAKKVLVGLPFTSVLSPMPLEADVGNGTSFGKVRTYGKTVLRLFRSVGGAYAATKRWDVFNAAEAWKNLEFYELPFLPEKYGEACQLYSGDIEVNLPGGMDPDSSVWIKQDKPLPFRLVALGTDLAFGEE